ncbi:MAG: DNA polymerase I [Eubacterium sp.]|nr:DNA polymerase I [Eubacterium sp.]
MKEKILLIDGHSILNRTFYGLPDLTNSAGQHTNAVYGFLNILFKTVEEVEPSYIAVAFDLPAPTFRHGLYDAYKGTRKPMPAELREQVPLMKEVLAAMGIPSLSQEGYEADDMLGTAAVKAAGEGMDAVILSGDRDLLQLVRDDITVRLPKTKQGRTTMEIYDPAAVEAAFSLKPEQIVDLKALMGDSSDNIPGLPGVGEKTATAILTAYGTLENAHEHRSEIKPKKAQTAMEEHYDLAELSKTLATIKTDAPLPISFDEMKMGDLYTGEAYELFRKLEFKNFLPRFAASAVQEKKYGTETVTGIHDAEALFETVSSAESFGFFLYAPEGVKGLAFSLPEKLAYIPAEGFVTEAYLCERLGKLLAGAKTAGTCRFKEQQNILRIPENGGIFDAGIAAYLCDPLRNGYTYDAIAAGWCDTSLPPAEELAGGKIKPGQVLDGQAAADFAGYHALAGRLAMEKMPGILKEKGMDRLFAEIEMPLTFVLSDMETAGIRIKNDELMKISETLAASIREEEQTIYSLAGEEFNIQSPKQLGVILFEKMKLPGGKKTKTGYSTAADILEKLAEDAPIAEHILKYRQYAKLKSTYTDALGEYADENGRIHSHFQQTVTATGRLSSTDPNLQNIPVRDALGKQIRKVFVPEDGCVFIDADYSQIELRVMASLSGDEKLIAAYRSASDIHAITASQVFGVPLSEVTPQMRRNAKAVNFGIIYGISSFGLSQGLSITRKEAAAYIEQYFKTYPRIKSYLDETVKAAKEKGYTVTAYGRIRPLPELASSNFMTRSFGERVAMNAPIQGTAADIIKMAMLKVSRRLKEEDMKTRLILQVHDELLLEAPEEEAEKACALLKEEMENASDLLVPMEVEVMTGTNWFEAH